MRSSSRSRRSRRYRLVARPSALSGIALLAAMGCAAESPAPHAPSPSPAPSPVVTPAAPGVASPTAGLAYPPWPVGNAADAYHGVTVPDPYRALEPWNDDVKRWTAEQTKIARAEIDRYPGLAALRARVTELKHGGGPTFFGWSARKGTVFALHHAPPKQQAMLVVLRAAADPKSARVIVDPNQIDPTGKTTIDFFVPSLDGKRVAISLSKAGTESGDVHVFDVASGKELPDVIARVNGGTAGGSVAWNAAGTGFYYTRYPREGERPAADLTFYQQLYYHEIGKKEADDKYVLGKEFPRIAEITVKTREDGKYVALELQNGDGGEVAYYLLGPSGKWTQISKYEDKVVGLSFGKDDNLYLESQAGATRGKVVRVPASKPDLATAQTIVPESDARISSVTVTDKRVYVREIVGGPSRVRVFDLAGKPQPALALPPVARVDHVYRLGGEEVIFSVQTFIDPPAWYRYAGTGAVAKTAFATTSPADFGDAEVLRDTCTSKDGTKVPVSIIQRKGAPRDGSNPTLLTGYGGYDISIEPKFDEDYRPLLDAGMVMAVANLRGGGELGEAWHEAGKLTKKQNVFDDFAACAEHLVSSKVTRREKLAIVGGSNGGLLMGAMITQHPELFKAVVARVGIFDSLRAETDPNGEFIATEVGTTKVREQFEALRAYSPYHHVAKRADYPAVLLITAANDPRVAPWHSRKMAAALQATGTKAPVLLLTRMDAGHGGGRSLDEDITENVDIDAFVFAQLGVEYPSGAAGAAASVRSR